VLVLYLNLKNYVLHHPRFNSRVISRKRRNLQNLHEQICSTRGRCSSLWNQTSHRAVGLHVEACFWPPDGCEPSMASSDIYPARCCRAHRLIAHFVLWTLGTTCLRLSGFHRAFLWGSMRGTGPAHRAQSSSAGTSCAWWWMWLLVGESNFLLERRTLHVLFQAILFNVTSLTFFRLTIFFLMFEALMSSK